MQLRSVGFLGRVVVPLAFCCCGLVNSGVAIENDAQKTAEGAGDQQEKDNGNDNSEGRAVHRLCSGQLACPKGHCACHKRQKRKNWDAQPSSPCCGGQNNNENQASQRQGNHDPGF